MIARARKTSSPTLTGLVLGSTLLLAATSVRAQNPDAEPAVDPIQRSANHVGNAFIRGGVLFAGLAFVGLGLDPHFGAAPELKTACAAFGANLATRAVAVAPTWGEWTKHTLLSTGAAALGSHFYNRTMYPNGFAYPAAMGASLVSLGGWFKATGASLSHTVQWVRDRASFRAPR